VLILSRAKVIDVMAEEGHQLALVELKNGHHLHGKILDDTLELDGTPAIPIASIREIKVVHPPDLSLFAIIFGLVTLTLMEIVLGVDNIIFLAIVAGRLPKEQQRSARRVGLVAALGTRLVLLFTLTWILGLTKPVFKLPIPGMSPDAAEVSWRDIILLLGGAFLIFKSVRELHHKVEETRSGTGAAKKERKPAGFVKTILLIAVIDIVFSLDSVITAVGMVDVLWVMVTAMVLAMGVMLFFAEAVSKFVDTYPTVKVLALSFLILIGVLLVAEGLGQHINKGYVYFAMAFAVGIEVINMALRPKPFADAVCDG
jgi:predicted tellurium resistance membrane protein TerC